MKRGQGNVKVIKKFVEVRSVMDMFRPVNQRNVSNYAENIALVYGNVVRIYPFHGVFSNWAFHMDFAHLSAYNPTRLSNHKLSEIAFNIDFANKNFFNDKSNLKGKKICYLER